MENYLHAPFLVLTELISIPTGLIFMAAIGTIWAGRLWLNVPMLFALAFVFNFMMGGITGIYLADVPTDLYLHDSYFVVAHFHYTIMGGEIFALMAATYFWFPKMTGRMYNERLGQIHFWMMFIGFQLVFLPMFDVGIKGMNRRVADFPSAYDDFNMFITASAFFLGASFIPFTWNLLISWIRGPVAEANPYRASTLEWQVPSPPPEHSFPETPEVVGPPYPYGQPDVQHVPGPIGTAGAPAGGGGGGGGGG
jgi:cytochrome c oxidase subunit 1